MKFVDNQPHSHKQRTNNFVKPNQTKNEVGERLERYREDKGDRKLCKDL